MSYDIRVTVKVEGCDKYAVVGTPEYDSPTYNLRKMFVACMDWDYHQGEVYAAEFALEKLGNGLRELTTRRGNYTMYNPSNGWGDIDSAIKAICSAITCINECAENYPMSCLYFEW